MLKTIFSYLLSNDRFFSIVYPYIDKKIIDDKEYRFILDKIKIYTDKYSKRPDYDEVKLLLERDQNIDLDSTAQTIKELNRLKKIPIKENLEFVIDETEKWVQEESLKQAILESVQIIDEKGSQTQIYDKVKEAISIDFKHSLGMEYMFDYGSQYDFYISDEEKFETSVEAINNAFCGGLPRKTISAFIGRSNIGKTLVLCHMAADFTRQGYNVLYVSGEMSEQMLYQRIDSNILNMDMHQFDINLSKKSYKERIKSILTTKKMGRLLIKEYPTGTANKLHIQNFLRELKLKKNDFKPDVIIIDYLNIFSSCRLPASQGSDSYRYIKAITEEFRALAVEENVAVLTATQTNRAGSEKTVKDSSMTDTSDSFGIPMTLDCMMSILQNDEMAEQNKYVFKVLKTRFGANVDQYYTVGVNKHKMTLYDLEESEQVIPVAVKDRLDYQNQQKKGAINEFDEDGDEKDILFDDDLA